MKLVIKYPKTLSDKPIISDLIKKYDLTINFLKANINPEMEGLLIIELIGDRCEEGINYLNDNGISVQPLSKDIIRDEKKCTECGACVVHCPSSALHFANLNNTVDFDSEKCVACEECISICPFKAMTLKY
jgi:L-aspartate semialdehyde sulfurtransferase ferredoxin